MSYDITFVPIYEVSNWITKTGKNPDEMCYDDYSKFEENECTYLSYNFAIFSELWYARDNFGKILLGDSQVPLLFHIKYYYSHCTLLYYLFYIFYSYNTL